MLTLTYVFLREGHQKSQSAQVMTTVEMGKIARKEYVLVLTVAIHRVVQDWDAMHIKSVFLFPAGGMTSVEEENYARKEYVFLKDHFHSQVEWGQEEEAWDQEEWDQEDQEVCSLKEEDHGEEDPSKFLHEIMKQSHLVFEKKMYSIHWMIYILNKQRE